LYVDINAVPELRHSPAAQDLRCSAAFQAELGRLAMGSNVDYAAVMGLKRQVLQACAETFEQAGSERRSAYNAFAARQHDLTSYAEFRAAHDQLPETATYHRYAQFVADEQLALAAGQRDGRAGLYLDFPVGVAPRRVRRLGRAGAVRLGGRRRPA